MSDPLSRPFSTLLSSQDSWIQRIRENFQQALAPMRVFPSSANGAPIHLPRWEQSPQSNHSQGTSLITHVVVLGMLVLLSLPARNPDNPHVPPGVKVPHIFPPSGHFLNSLLGSRLSDGSGSGGGRTQIPTTAGNLVPVSSIQIVRPSLPPKRESIVPVPPTILDPAAPPVLSSVAKIGLPWMQEDTGSSGPGDSNTIGNGPGNTMGDGPVDGHGGRGSSALSYRAGVTSPACAYCPDPQYSDEAREAKLQGRVTLRVLVGADGRAAQIQMIQGIGMGLDEHAVQAVRSWRFIPARDAARRAVPTWVTIEVFFRLI